MASSFFLPITALLVIGIISCNSNSHSDQKNLNSKESMRKEHKNLCTDDAKSKTYKIKAARYKYERLTGNSYMTEEDVTGTEALSNSINKKNEENNLSNADKGDNGINFQSGKWSTNKEQLKPYFEEALKATTVDVDGVRRETHTKSSFLSSKLSYVTKHRWGRQISSQDPCSMYGTCDINDGKLIRNCYCDTDCTIYRDCCFDSGSIQMTQFSRKQQIISFMSCEVVAIPPKRYRGINLGYFMVTSCPSEVASTEYETKCRENTDNEIPVSDEHGITYRNVYCALCHGVKRYENWNIIFLFQTCNDFDYLSLTETTTEGKIEILKEKNCEMYYLPPSAMSENITTFPRSCITEEKKYYKKPMRNSCTRFANPIMLLEYEEGHSVYIRNYFCMNSKFTSNKYECVFEREKNPYARFITKKGLNILPMTVMFQFQPVLQNGEDRQHCSKRETDSTPMDMCISSTCIDGYLNRGCAKEIVRGYVLSYDVVLESYQVLPWEFFERAMVVYYLSLPISTYELSIFTKWYVGLRGEVSCGSNINDEGNSCCVSLIKLKVSIGRTMNLQEVGKFRSSALNMHFVYKEKDVNSSEIRITTNNLNFKNSSCQLDTNNTINSMFYLDKPAVDVFMDIVDMNSFEINITEIPQRSDVEVQIDNNPDDSGEISLFDLSRVQVLNWNVTFFHPGNTQSSLVLTHNSTTIQTIITYITMGTSTLALIVSLGIFTYFGLNKGLAGNVCTNILSTSLFANILFMFGVGATDNQMICSVIGVCLHYIWLCVFSWISLYTFLVTRLLVEIEKNLSVAPETMFSKKYIYLFGFGAPMLIVVPCILIEWLEFVDIKIGYNGDVCFPSGYPSNIIFYTGPVAISLILNFVLLMVTFRQIQRYKENSDKLTGTARKSMIYIIAFIKLCSISGLFWIFGILSQALQNEILGYIFIIVSGFQGMIVSVCFLTSDRVCNTLSTFFKKKDIPRDIELNKF